MRKKLNKLNMLSYTNNNKYPYLINNFESKTAK